MIANSLKIKERRDKVKRIYLEIAATIASAEKRQVKDAKKKSVLVKQTEDLHKNAVDKHLEVC